MSKYAEHLLISFRDAKTLQAHISRLYFLRRALIGQTPACGTAQRVPCGDAPVAARFDAKPFDREEREDAGQGIGRGVD